MDFQAMVDSLVEFMDEAAIRVEWEKAANALISRSTVLVHITSQSQEGRAASGQELSSPEDIGTFIRACQAAIKILTEDTSVDVNQLGAGVDFSHRRVES